ncbi:hypothetical protein V1517DRAFT_123131 [Lipomyces orientalis]|uniref:Uncharacterized protein n=1 Tax=Lipomyces orientalis TaxID=1233043 RepID=A0ACC3TNG7_9ASCO
MYDDKALCRYLREMPARHDFSYTDETKRSLLRILFNSISANGKYLSFFFPHGPPAITEEWKMTTGESDPSHPGRPCMHQFQKGEPTYKCKECGLDDTCVLCWRCFNASDHIGHAVTVSISQKDGGGVCDCGDPEAWLRDVNCKYYSTTQAPPKPLPDHLIESIRGTVARTLDYILDVFSCSPQSYQDCKDEELIQKDFESFALDPNIYGGKPGERDKDNGQFALVLWNDEKHSFTDVIHIVMRATKRREEYGKFISEEVDVIGRKIVSTSSNVKDLIAAREIIDRIQLAVSIRSTRDTFREDMCGTMLEWLTDIATSPLVGHHFVLRDLICESLCQPWRVGSTATRVKQPLYQLSGHFDDPDDDLSIPSGPMGTVEGIAEIHSPGDHPLSDGAEGTGSAQSMSAPQYWLESADAESATSSPFFSNSSSAKLKDTDIRRLRLDYLMMFDLRFWKTARYAIRDLLMSTMISNLDYKSTMGMHFAELYPELVEYYMLADREPDCSMMLLSTQLFTCPTIATEIVKKHFSSFVAILYTYLTKGRVGPPSSVDLTAPIPSDRRTLKNRRIQQVFVDIDHIITRNVVKQRISCDDSRISQVADIFILFEGCAPFIRQINEHVEYESTEWVSFFQVLAPIVKLSRLVAKACWEGPLATTRKSIRAVARMLTAWSLGFMRDRFPNCEVMDEPHFHALTSGDFSNTSYPIVQFPVEFYVLSMHHPLHGFLTWLIEFGRVESAEQLKSLLSFSLLDPPAPGRSIIYGPEDMLMLMLDYPLRTLVLVAQIRVGLWVRNGYTLRTHEIHYRDMSMRDSGYARDIFGVQVMMATCNPSRVMLTIIERWSLVHWLRGAVEHPTFEEGKLLYIMEEFVHEMIVLLSERKRLLGNDYERTNEALIKREIIQVLCFGPMAFSDLARKMPEYLSNDEKFEAILREITKYKAPEGLSDFGTYELKEQYYNEMDPYFFHYTATQWDAAESAVKKVISSSTGHSLEKVVIEPHLEQITTGPFTRLGWIVGTPEFAQFIYVTLCNVAFQRLSPTTSLPESLLNLTLHLCHVAIIEDKVCVPDKDRKLPTFCYNACYIEATKVGPTDGQYQTILEVLCFIRDNAKFEANRPLVDRILHLIKEKEPEVYENGIKNVSGAMEEVEESNDLNMEEEAETPAERKKRLAKERQAKIMAEFQNQQQKFAEKHKGTFDDEDDMEEDEEMLDDEETETWKFPSGTCILCRKPTTEAEIYGTIGLLTESTLFRQIPFESSEWMVDAISGEPDLDRPRTQLNSSSPVDDAGSSDEDDLIGSGFPHESVNKEPVTVSCGHIMHLSCYEEYKEAIQSRHRQHITRNPPENTKKGEFLCPLCKSLNNAFLPIIFKGVEKALDAELTTSVPFSEWIVDDVWNIITQMKTSGDLVDGIYLFNDLVRGRIRGSAESTLLPFYLRKFTFGSDVSWMHMPRLFGTMSQQFEERRSLSAEMDAIKNVYVSNAKVLSALVRSQGTTRLNQDLSPFQRLIKLYASTISSSEIALRGANRTESGAEIGMSILDQVSQRTLALLRTLRATALTFGSFSVMDNVDKLMGVSIPYSKVHHQQIGKLFFGQECMYDKDAVSCPNIVLPLLVEDIFEFLAESSVCMVIAMDVELHHVMMLCYVAQVVKILYLLGDQIYKGPAWLGIPQIQTLGEEAEVSDELLFQMRDFMNMILQESGHFHESYADVFRIVPGKTIYAMVKRFVLPFLRKCAILSYVSGPIGYNGDALLDVETDDEMSRLLTLLKLPSMDEMFSAFCGDTQFEQNKVMLEVITRWCRHLEFTVRRPKSLQTSNITLEYPGVLHLLRLPRRLHSFFQEVGKMKCKKCGKSPEDPGVCLFCGDLVCCQNYCCVDERGTGECNQHMNSCAGYIGIFLLIKKCTILFLKDGQGSFVVAPYLDVHGEVDPHLKRGRPLYLSQKRYENLIRNIWLQNGMASQIARRIESTVDNGGWEGM